MNSFITRLQKDLNKFQATIQKEGNDLLDKLKNLDLKDNLEARRKDLEKVIDAKLGKLEPVYNKLMDEIRKNAKKAGIDLTKLEKQIKKSAVAASKTLKTATGKVTKKAGKKTTKKKSKSTAKKATKRKASQSVARKKKTTKKTSANTASNA